MSDLISRKALLEEIQENHWGWFSREMLLSMLENQPSVTCTNSGKWILEERAGIDYWCCSECHKIKSEYYAKPKDNFCGHCGCDMRADYEKGMHDAMMMKENADRCKGCAFEDVESWEPPCGICKRNSKDYWRAKKV